MEEPLFFADSREWRAWLEQHHQQSKGVWLVHYKKASGKTSVSYDEALEEALCFGWIDSIMKSLDGEKYILRYTPRKGKSIWSRRNRVKAEKLTEAGKMTPAGLEQIEKAKRNGLWQTAYTSRMKEPVPPDLKEALGENKDAEKHFNGFAPSYRNMYIMWINDAKMEKTREKRIAEVVRRSAINQKPGI